MSRTSGSMVTGSSSEVASSPSTPTRYGGERRLPRRSCSLAEQGFPTLPPRSRRTLERPSVASDLRRVPRGGPFLSAVPSARFNELSKYIGKERARRADEHEERIARREAR